MRSSSAININSLGIVITTGVSFFANANDVNIMIGSNIMPNSGLMKDIAAYTILIPAMK